ncbi:MAG TPA: hypothetical protein VGH45_08430 [Solirubrobacteraceae bacterium]|jgi:hypothetical protein
MKGFMGTRRLAALFVALATGVALTAGASGASAATTSVTRTFNFIGKPNSRTITLFNVDGMSANARCNASGDPVVFAFSAATNADLFGRLFDGLGRFHIIKNSSFIRSNRGGVRLSPTSGDFDSTGTVLYENSRGLTVTVNYAVDDSTTLNHLNVCTVYGSFIAT